MILHFHYIRAQYEPAVSLLRSQFCRAPASLASFQRSMNSVAQLLDQQTVAESMLDLHGLPDLSLDKQFWVAAHWLRRVSVPSLRHVAIVLPADGLYNQMVIETLHRAGRHFIHYEIQFFPDTVMALDWLLSFHDPSAQATLEQEWAGAAASGPGASSVV